MHKFKIRLAALLLAFVLAVSPVAATRAEAFAVGAAFSYAMQMFSMCGAGFGVVPSRGQALADIVNSVSASWRRYCEARGENPYLLAQDIVRYMRFNVRNQHPNLVIGSYAAARLLNFWRSVESLDTADSSTEVVISREKTLTFELNNGVRLSPYISYDTFGSASVSYYYSPYDTKPSYFSGVLDIEQDSSEQKRYGFLSVCYDYPAFHGYPTLAFIIPVTKKSYNGYLVYGNDITCLKINGGTTATRSFIGSTNYLGADNDYVYSGVKVFKDYIYSNSVKSATVYFFVLYGRAFSDYSNYGKGNIESFDSVSFDSSIKTVPYSSIISSDFIFDDIAVDGNHTGKVNPSISSSIERGQAISIPIPSSIAPAGDLSSYESVDTYIDAMDYPIVSGDVPLVDAWGDMATGAISISQPDADELIFSDAAIDDSIIIDNITDLDPAIGGGSLDLTGVLDFLQQLLDTLIGSPMAIYELLTEPLSAILHAIGDTADLLDLGFSQLLDGITGTMADLIDPSVPRLLEDIGDLILGFADAVGITIPAGITDILEWLQDIGGALDVSIPEALARILDGVLALPDAIAEIPAAIRALPDAIADAITGEAAEDVPSTLTPEGAAGSLVDWAIGKINVDDGLFSKFPFCIPYDLVLFVSGLSGEEPSVSNALTVDDRQGRAAPPVLTLSLALPSFTGEAESYTFTVDFRKYSDIADLSRSGFTIMIIAYLLISELKKWRK